MKKILVIGGTGAIGLPTVRTLLESGHDVRSTARGEEKQRRLHQLGAEPVEIDIYDVDALRGAMRGCDAVLRLTTKVPASMSKMRSKRAWEGTNRVRALGATRIVDAALAEGIGTFVQESFFSAYAGCGDRWVDESFPADDGGLDTMRATLEAERQAARFSAGGACGVSLRFGGFYGLEAPSSRELIALMKKRMLPVIGRGDFYFPSVFIDDAAAAVAAALEAPAGLYNVCDDEPLQWREYVRSIARAAHAPAPMSLPGFLGSLAVGYPWQWMTRSIRLSNRRFKDLSGWAPRIKNARDGWPAVVASIESETAVRMPRGLPE